jgi:hypothetical protein
MWREPGPEEVVLLYVREEDEHASCYMVMLDIMFSSTWQYLQGSHPTYALVMVPHLLVFTTRGLGTGSPRLVLLGETY